MTTDPRVGLEVKSRTPLKSVFLLFCYGKNLCKWLVRHGIVGQYDPMFDLKIFVGHCDL